MKKLLALILAAALALSLVACGGGSGAGDTNTPNDTPSGGNGDTTSTDTPSEDINPNDVAIGTWKGECDTSRGHMILVLEINKGGTGRLKRYFSDGHGTADDKYNNNDPNDSLPGTWEVIDDVLNFTEQNGFGGSQSSGFDFDIEQETLTSFEHDDLVLTKVS